MKRQVGNRFLIRKRKAKEGGITMRSTFMGLETARRGLSTQQYALETTGNNIANANTPGYTRQRVNFEPTEPYPPVGMNRPELPGQMGTGVRAGSIQRVRESFLDLQYRQENTKFGYWNARSEALARMEEILNEPGQDGLSATLDRFWQSLHDLAADPSDSGARSVVRERGIAVADTFNYLSQSLLTIQANIEYDIDVTVKEVNSIAQQLDNINKQIAGIEPHGYLPNDLYDERDRLLDRLSEIVDIRVDYKKYDDEKFPLAEGVASVTIVGTGHQLVDGRSLTYSEIDNSIKVEGQKGKLSALLEMHEEYTDMLENLDEMAYAFVTQFNAVHRQGYTLGEEPNKTGINFFVEFEDDEIEGAARQIKLDEKILESLDHIAASGSDEQYPGNGENALLLAEVKNSIVEDPNSKLNGKTIQGFYQELIGQMGVDAQEANRMKNNTIALKTSVDVRRESVSGVSLDEEMINLVRFQQAYNASARVVTSIDEMLDRIINGMGIVGR